MYQRKQDATMIQLAIQKFQYCVFLHIIGKYRSQYVVGNNFCGFVDFKVPTKILALKNLSCSIFQQGKKFYPQTVRFAIFKNLTLKFTVTHVITYTTPEKFT